MSGIEKGIDVRIAKAFSAEIIGQAINIASRFVLTPLFLMKWGVDDYGLWLTLTSFVYVLSLSDFGGIIYFTNHQTKAYSEANFELFKKIYSSSLALYLVIATALMLITTVVMALLPSDFIQNSVFVSATDVKWIFILLIARISAQLPVSVVQSTLRSTKNQHTSVMIDNVAASLYTFVIIAALLIYPNPVLVAALELTLPITTILMFSLVYKSRIPSWINVYSLNDADANIIKDAVKPSLHFLSIQINQVLSTQGLILVVSKLLGPREVTIISTAKIVTNTINRFMGMIAHSMWAEMTLLYHEGKIAKLIKIFTIYLYTSVLIGSCIYSMFFFFGSKLFLWWVQTDSLYDGDLMLLLILVTLISSTVNCGCSLLMTINQHQLFSKVQIPATVLSYVIPLTLLQTPTLNEIVLATSVVQLIAIFISVKISLSSLKYPILSKRFTRAVVVSLIVSGCLAYLSW